MSNIMTELLALADLVHEFQAGAGSMIEDHVRVEDWNVEASGDPEVNVSNYGGTVDITVDLRDMDYEIDSDWSEATEAIDEMLEEIYSAIKGMEKFATGVLPSTLVIDGITYTAQPQPELN